MKSQRESFIFYYSFLQSIEKLKTAKEREKALMSILKYAFYGEDNQPDGYAAIPYIMAKPQIDKSVKRYEKCVTNGKKGGRPKKNQEENQEQNQKGKKEQNQEENKQDLSRQNLNYNYNYNDNDNVNYNDNVNDNNVYCTELECSSSIPEEKATITLTLNDKSEYPIFDKNIAEWKELYPNVDILQELRNMKGWLNSNPTKRKTKSGILRFINSWLAREQNKGGCRNYGANTTYGTTSNGQYQEQEPECFSDKWIREKREAAEARGETFDIEAGEYDF